MKVEKFTDLEVWILSRELSLRIFEITSNDDFKKDFRFRDQIRSSAGSVMDNIAEGFERGGNIELIQFLYIAKGSCGEARSQLYRAFDFGYITQEYLDDLILLAESISLKLGRFINYLKTSDFKGAKNHR